MDQMRLILGDITRLQVDAIVNAANNELRGGGGVDGAIHRAGGPTIMKECRKIGHCATGEAVITGAGELPARYVIHTVGPVWYGGTGNEVELLRSAYTSSLELAADHGLRTIAFPNISTGVYGFPKEKAARIAVDTCSEFLAWKTKNMEITFVCYDDLNYQYYAKLLET